MTLHDPFNATEPPRHLEFARGGIVSVGNFDGVHSGHRALLAVLRHQARERGVPAVVISFVPHPLAILRPTLAPVPLLWPERKAELLRAGGVDHVVYLHSSPQLFELTAERFIQDILWHQFQAVGMVEGANFAFGKGRAGNIQLLRNLCASANKNLTVVPLMAHAGERVSSTRARQAVTEGDMTACSRLLGRPHRLRGTVVAGAARGRTLGFPTANLSDMDVLLPADGVYMTRARVQGQWFMGIANIGPNPTFDTQARKVEIHLLDFQDDLYGTTLEVDFLARLRPTQKFPDIEALRNQLRADEEQTRQAFVHDYSLVESPESELSQTITAWIRAKTAPDGSLDQVLENARLLPGGELRVQWKPLPALTPDQTLALVHLEEQLRVVFPEVTKIIARS